MTIEERLDKIEATLFKIQIALSTNKQEIEQLEYEREQAENRAWEESMGEDL